MLVVVLLKLHLRFFCDFSALIRCIQKTGDIESIPSSLTLARHQTNRVSCDDAINTIND